jgi:Cu/Ag efflux pump CusA
MLDLNASIMDGAMDCVRPQIMAAVAIIDHRSTPADSLGHGTGSEAKRRIAVPRIGCLVSSLLGIPGHCYGNCYQLRRLGFFA